MGLVLSSLCLGIDLCRINLSIAPGHVHPEQWRAASTARVPPRIIDYKRENQISHFVLQKGPAERGFWGRNPQKCILQSSFVMFVWGLLRVCLLWEPLCVCLNFVLFGGVLGKGPGDELHHHQVQRDDDYGRWLEARLSVRVPDPSPDSCRLRGLQPEVRVRNQPSV